MSNQDTGIKSSTKPLSLAAQLAAKSAEKRDNPNADPISRETLETIDAKKLDVLAAGHTVPGTAPVVKPVDADCVTMPAHGIEKPAFDRGPPAMTSSFPHSPDNPAAAMPVSTSPYAGDPPAKPLDMAGIVRNGDAVQPVSSNNNSEANDIKYVPSSVEAPKGSYVALRLHSIIRHSGAKVVPTNGYYVVEDEEMAYLLSYYAGLNQGLVELVK